jgi:hypothetical protein
MAVVAGKSDIVQLALSTTAEFDHFAEVSKMVETRATIGFTILFFLSINFTFVTMIYAVYFILGNSKPRLFFLSHALSTKPNMRAATPRPANINRGAV